MTLRAARGGRGLVRMLPGVAVVAAALGGLWWQVRPLPSVAAPMPCTRAVMVDGRLRCDAEAPADLASLCPGARGPAVLGGDALDTAQLCSRPASRRGEPGWARMAPEDLAALHQPVEINHATEQELLSLPRIGPVLARRIVEGRPYAEVDELVRVRGIGPKTMQVVRPRVTVVRPAP